MSAGDVLGFIKNRPGNRLGNAAFDFWQRTTGFTITNTSIYVSDRIKDNALGSTIVVDITRESDVPPGSNFNFSHKTEVTTSDAMGGANDLISLEQRMEGFTIADLFGKEISKGFWVKTNKLGIYSATLSSSGGNSYIQEFEVTVADTWKFFSFNKTLLDVAFMNGSKGSGVGLILAIILDTGAGRKSSTLDSWAAQPFSSVGSDNQTSFGDTNGNYFQITELMLNEGPVVAQFERIGGSYAHDYEFCQRYFEKSWNLETPVGAVGIGSGRQFMAQNNIGRWSVSPGFKVQKRGSPVMTVYSPITGAAGVYRDESGGVDRVINLSETGTFGFTFNASNANASGNSSFHWTADTEL